jgi:outer membrane protein assembly factor BamB
MFVALICLALSAPSVASDWPQWAGPNRNFTVDDVGLADDWPDEGPRVLWSKDLGVGYSGIVVADGKLYTMYRKARTEEVEYTIALSADSGKTIWERAFPAPLVGPPAEPSDERWGGQGPNSTPLIVGDRLYTMGSRAVMRCHDRKTGDVVWWRDLATEFGATYAGRKNNDTGYPSSPVAYGDSIIVPLGRSRVGSPVPGQSLVALDRRDGTLRWKSLDFSYGFASPILIKIDGRDQLVLHVKGAVMGVDPTRGAMLWRHGLTSEWEPTITPVWDRGRAVLVVDGEQTRLIELTVDEDKTVPRQRWSSSQMKAVVPTPVLVGETVYGSTRNMLVALSAATGEQLWAERGFPMASIVHAAGRLILLDENGQLSLAAATAKKLTVHAQFPATEKYSLTAPALVDSVLYLRDRKRILALDLAVARFPTPTDPD